MPDARKLPESELVWMHERASDAEVHAYRDAARISGELREAMKQLTHYLATPHRLEPYLVL